MEYTDVKYMGEDILLPVYANIMDEEIGYDLEKTDLIDTDTISEEYYGE